MVKRIQPRRGNGQYQRATLGNTFGLGNEICPTCGQCHPFKVGIFHPPAECESCGEDLPWKVAAEARHDAERHWIEHGPGRR